MAQTPAGAPWGATPEDWRRFERLGLTADLLPVVSNPRAEISPMSKLRDLGKTPSRYDAHGKVVGIPQWTRHRAADRDIGRWAQNTDLGICVQTRRAPAVDIDLPDPARSAEVVAFAELALPALPMRTRPNSGKCLLWFRLPAGVELTKRILRTAHGNIELLANGQQFVAVGTHPSGVRYEWSGGLPDELPLLTLAELDAFWQGLVDAFGLPDGEARERAGMLPAVPRRAGDMNDPVVAWLDENGWVTGFERDGRVDVRCPWEDGHSTDSGPSSSSYFPAGVGGFMQGHYRCLHASCSGRTDGDFFNAVGYLQADFEVVEVAPAELGAEGEGAQPLPAFTRTRTGAIEGTLGNVLLALRRPDVCKVHIGRDRFADELMVAIWREGEAPQWRTFTDEDYTRLRDYLTRGAAAFQEIGRELMRDAVALVGSDNAFDAAQAWLAGLPAWDGVERVRTFFSRYLGAADTPYHQAVGAYLWTALAGRVLDPGCQADMALVLLGAQGCGKTSAVKALVPGEEQFVEINLAHRDENLSRALRGKLVGELGELRGLASREAEDIKAWISRRWEEWVPKYREFATKFPRRLVLIGTGNEDQFLTDSTGNRRWLPARVGTEARIDVPGIEMDRGQLWAEGAAMWRAQGVLWREAEALGRAVHADHMAVDSWADVVETWLDTPDFEGAFPRARKFLRIGDVLREAIGMSPERVEKRDEMRMGKVLRTMGYERTKVRVKGKPDWGFVFPPVPTS